MNTKFTRKEKHAANPYGGENVVYFNPEMFIDNLFNETWFNERINGYEPPTCVGRGCIFDIHEIRQQQAAILMGWA